jgi:ribosomal silencing factor RsfS
MAAEGEASDVEADAAVTAEDDAETGGTIVVEGQHANENGVVIIQGEAVTDVEATAAESSDAMATEGEDTMEMDGTTEPMEGVAATQEN